MIQNDDTKILGNKQARDYLDEALMTLNQEQMKSGSKHFFPLKSSCYSSACKSFG
jgi:hypothetical protein